MLCETGPGFARQTLHPPAVEGPSTHHDSSTGCTHRYGFLGCGFHTGLVRKLLSCLLQILAEDQARERAVKIVASVYTTQEKKKKQSRDQVDISALGSICNLEKNTYIFPCFFCGLVQNQSPPQAQYLLDKNPTS